MNRLTAKSEVPVGAVSAEEDYEKPPNYDSFKPLFFEERRRGTVRKTFKRAPLAIAVDFSGKMAITELMVPPDIVRMMDQR